MLIYYLIVKIIVLVVTARLSHPSYLILSEMK